MKNYVALLMLVTHIGMNGIAMEDNFTDDSKKKQETEISIASNGFPWASKKERQCFSKDFKDAYNPTETILFDNYAAITDTTATLTLSEDDQEKLRTGYQTIHYKLSLMSKEHAKESTLRTYKQLIYQAVQKLLNDKEGAKQWLKAAHYYSDEEEELDKYDAKKEEKGRNRDPYYTAKRSLALQKILIDEANPVKKKIEALAKEQANIESSIKKLQEKLVQLFAQKKDKKKGAAKLSTDLQATSRTINDTQSIADITIKAFKAIIQKNSASIKKLEKEIIEKNKDVSTVSYEKTAHQAEIKAKKKEITSLQETNQAVQRDIDLLKDKYTFGKKAQWVLPNWLLSYNVKNDTQSLTNDIATKEEGKE